MDENVFHVVVTGVVAQTDTVMEVSRSVISDSDMVGPDKYSEPEEAAVRVTEWIVKNLSKGATVTVNDVVVYPEHWAYLSVEVENHSPSVFEVENG